MKILHDVHIHNFLSTCSNDNRATVERYIEIERRQGIRLMGFANHTWDETVPLPVADYDFYRRQSLSFQQQIRPQIPADTGELKVLVGAETEYCGMFDCLGMSPEGARRLDFLLIPHSHTHMTDFVMPASENLPLAQEAIAKKLAETVDWLPFDDLLRVARRLPHGTVAPFVTQRQERIPFVSDFLVKSFDGLMKNQTLNRLVGTLPISVAHPFHPVGEPHREEILRRIPDETFGDLFAQAAARGIGLEINPWTTDEEERMFRIARACGCRFTLGSDAHTRAELSDIRRQQSRLDSLGLTEDDLMDFVRI